MREFKGGIPGYDPIELPARPELEGTENWTWHQWKADFESTADIVTTFLRIRDPFVVLARSASNFHMLGERGGRPENLQQAEIEITQALLLLNSRPTAQGPTSNRNLGRYWSALRRHIHAFIAKQPEVETQSPIERAVSQRARIQTIYYRNLFSREDCELTLHGILSRFDGQAQEILGYKLSDLFSAQVRIADMITGRLREFAAQIACLMTGKHRAELVRCIEFFRLAYPTADRSWKNRTDRFSDLEALRSAAFQMSELAHPWIYTFTRAELETEFPTVIVDALYGLAIAPGSISDIDPEYIYLSNPIWQRPYIVREDSSFFAALPQLVFSFPFTIVEFLIKGHTGLEIAYESARAIYLEEAVATLAATAMPSSAVYRGVAWEDPDTGQTWENDVVAAVGNFLFIFEAKSGRIKDASRRGGMQSLRKNFRNLFVEPGEQSGRLENYLNTKKQEARLRIRATGQEIGLDLAKAKVIFTFGICIEHFASLTSAKHYLKELGLVTSGTPWAPILSLGEFHMITKFLDSEVSFVHYMTRRATLEQVLDFEGDEQDILSAYMINGLWIDGDALSGHRVTFFNSDAPVRSKKLARSNRTAIELYGIQLSPLWRAIVGELYRDKTQRHRFDIINVILNQMPPALAQLERLVRRFRRGVTSLEGDTAFMRFAIGNKLFLLAIYMPKRLPNEIEWRDFGHDLVAMSMPDKGSVECAAFMFARRSRSTTFDGVSFYRSISVHK